MKNFLIFKNFNKDFSKIFLVNVFIFVGFEITFPILSLWILSLGASGRELGITLAGFTLSALLARNLTGKWMMKHSAKPVMVFSTALAIITIVLHSFVHTIFLIAILRLVCGLAWGALSTAVNAWLTRSLDSDELGRGISIFGMGTSSALAIGPFLGLELFGKFGMPAISGTSAVVLALVLIPLFLAKSSGAPKIVSAEEKTKELVVSTRHFVIMFLLSIFGFAYVSILYFIPAYLASKALFGAGIYLFTQATLAVLVRPAVGRGYEKYGPQKILASGFLLLFLAFIILSIVSNLTTLVISAIFFGSGFGFIFSAGQAWLVSLFSNREQGRANALFFNSFDSGIFLGSIAVGALTDIFSYQLIYLSIATALLVAGIISLQFEKNSTINK